MSRRKPYDLPAPTDGAKVFWKSLEDKADPAAAQLRAESELAPGAVPEGARLVTLRKKGAPDKKPSDQAIGRRGFMFFAGASAALAAEGCARRPIEKIMPYSKAPEHVLPGVPQHYATVRPFRSDALGLVVESHEGRPTKVEGNPDHPSSYGGTDVWAQGLIYDIFDPDRSLTPRKGAKGAAEHTPATWTEAEGAIMGIARSAQADRGAKLRILVGPTTSPTFLRLRDALKAKLPRAQVHVWSPVNEGNAREGARIAFGQPVNVVPRFSQAKVIVSLDSDFLGTESGHVRANREFIAGRKLKSADDSMSRLYVVEPAFTTTGMNADHRLRLPAQDVGRYLLALAKELSDKHGVDLGPAAAAVAGADATGIPPKWIAAVAKDLAGARAKGVLVCGSRQPAHVHALVHALNSALGNAGHTIDYYSVADNFEPDPAASIKQLADDITKGAVGALVILGGNPVYDAPFDVRFADKLKSVATTLHLSSHYDETSAACTWHIPRANDLEAWGDFAALDGTVAIQQPLIAPLYDGKSDIEILARLAGEPTTKGYDLVKQTMNGVGSAASKRVWDEALKKGVAGAPSRPLGPMDARKAEVASALAKAKAPAPLGAGNLEVTFAPCPKLFDGRYANNPLLLELPDPVTKITWDNVAFISTNTAKELDLENRQTVRLTRDGAGPIDVAVWITPGQADHSIGLLLGWGRQRAGRYGDKHGFDVTPLRTTDALWIASGVKLAKLDVGAIEAIKDRYRRPGCAATDSPAPGRVRPNDPFDAANRRLYKISQTQDHDTMEGRPIAVDATLEEYKKNAFFPRFSDHEHKDMNHALEEGQPRDKREHGTADPEVPPLWTRVDYSRVNKWGMGIDLTSCTGCNACVIACQIENNVPAVGKEQIERGREMHWLRIDRYFVGLDVNDPQVVMQPVACVHCEEAPCENVCPVNATEHSPEGLNDMAYNRCIGTRYCANNCPYKVRRFNFLNYHTSGGWYDDVPESEKMHFNPNVTVRFRGVMEKCTYCVQRIETAKIKSKRTGKPIEEGDVTPACAQACPTTAIVFGDLNDPKTKVAQWHARDRAYRLLAELGTHPRTSYLGKIRNPNPEMGA